MNTKINIFPDLPILKQDQSLTLDAFKKGDIDDLRVTQQMPIDDIVEYGLSEGFLAKGLRSFPDPRKHIEIPIDVLLLPQVIQRLDDEHSLVTAPYMLNSAELITKLGYSARVLDEGFNNRNKYPRKTIFNGETLKHVLLSCSADNLINWFNTSWNTILKDESPGRTQHYIIDGTKLHVPAHLYKKFQGAGVLKNSDGSYEYGYKVVWIQEVIDKKGVIRSLKFAPINEHDLPLGKELVENFEFEEGSLLLMDRGFLDGDWIRSLKEIRKIDVCMPMKRNSEITQFAVAQAVAVNNWELHPTRKKQRIMKLSKSDLQWDNCPVFHSGVLVNFIKKNGEEEYVAFVDTRKNITPKTLLESYDLRSNIEESHRQMKCFQGLEKLPSKKYVQVIFRVIMGTISYNLFNLFLNSEKCETLDEFTLKTHRQKRRDERNPEIIIYTDSTFAIVKNLDFLQMLLSLNKTVQSKLLKLFKDWSLDSILSG